MNIIAWSNCYETIFTPELVPSLSAPASSIFSAASLSLIPPEAFTFSPYGDTVSNISLTSSALAPTPFFTKPVEVFTKSAFASMHNSQAFFISSFVNRSVAGCFYCFYIIYYEIIVFIF